MFLEWKGTITCRRQLWYGFVMQQEARDRARFWRQVGGLALAGAAVAVPVAVHLLIRHRLRPPRAPIWGRSHRYASRHGPVPFQEVGTGPPVVLLHALGAGCDGEQWRAAAEALAPRFRVYVPELPGWGRAAPALAPRPDLYLEMLAEFLAGAVREPAVLAGAGLAAAYAVVLGSEYPERVRAVALTAPEGLPLALQACCGRRAAGRPAANGRAAWSWLLGVPLLRVPLLDALTSRLALAGHLRSRVYAAPERVDAALVDHHYRVSHLPAHRAAVTAYWRGRLDPPGAAALRQLRSPVWLALGSSADGTGERGGEALEHLPEGSRVEVFDGSRTWPHAEQPVAWSTALARFIDQLPA
jgi:pimeloyl-ACP methyl ester carboxylesterase